MGKHLTLAQHHRRWEVSNFGGIDPLPGGLGAKAPQRGPGAEPLVGVWGRSPQENFAKNAANLLIFMHIKYVKNKYSTMRSKRVN